MSPISVALCPAYYAPTVGKGTISIAFVCLSVRHIHSEYSRTQRPELEGRFCDVHTSFQVKRSKVRTGGGREHTVMCIMVADTE